MTNIYPVYIDSGYYLENLPGVMDDIAWERERERESERESERERERERES